jgi:hypothetical protein
MAKRGGGGGWSPGMFVLLAIIGICVLMILLGSPGASH